MEASRRTEALAPHSVVQWVHNTIEPLCQPDQVMWCNGSEHEFARLCGELEKSGTLTRLNARKRPNSFLARSDPRDVARLEGRTFICSERKSVSGSV